MDIHKLPDFPALAQLAHSLWGKGEIRGAAVMVGAGFSRNALRPLPNSPMPPLWWNFKDAMLKQLYPPNEGPSDPLRLAQEYKIALGDTALDNLIREHIQDDHWLPGPLHQQLLALPWAEVLTTNWDRLLEKAAVNILEREYEVVLTTADIARKRSPRIVKLHGSLPSHTPLIFTEDDYRTYPQTHAPFVNLARQVLFENELCLLGFSGDDPNFLQWSGWVRDELGGGQRRIYLAGVLGLSTSNRRLLESRGVIPIDLAPLVIELDKEIQHQRASEVFLDYLTNCKPEPAHVWPPKSMAEEVDNEFGIPLEAEYPNDHLRANNPDQCVEPLRKHIKKWQAERACYPGWLVLPDQYTYTLHTSTVAVIYDLKHVLPLLKIDERGRAIYEIVWRLEHAFTQLYLDLLPLIEQAVVAEDAKGLSLAERLFLATTLLRTARENYNETEFARWRSWIEKEAGTYSAYADLLAQCQYEVCLWARDTLDFAELAANIHKIVGNDPIWALRRASLYSELCNFDAAQVEIEKALRQLREISMRDRRSIWAISRQAWVHYIARGISYRWSGTEFEHIVGQEWPSQYIAEKCDPWQQLQSIEDDINQEIQKENEKIIKKTPKFDPGSFSSNEFSTHWSGNLQDAQYRLRQLLDAIGIPLRLRHTNFVAKRFAHVIKKFDLNSVTAILICIRYLSATKEQAFLEKFSRVTLANLPSEFIAPVVEKLSAVISFGIPLLKTVAQENAGEQLNVIWSERLAYFINALSHFAIRLPSHEAKSLFLLGCQYATDHRIVDWRLYEPLENLLNRTFEAMTPIERSTVALDILQFPLQGERRQSDIDLIKWPSLTRQVQQVTITRLDNNPAWEQRISQLIEFSKSDAIRKRHAALFRLMFLFNNKALTDKEINLFGETLWLNCAKADLPRKTSFCSSTFLNLPAPPNVNPKEIFRQVFFEVPIDEDPTLGFLISIDNAGTGLGGKIPPCRPTTEQALHILNSLLAFRSKQENNPIYNTVMPILIATNNAIGPALAASVLPPLNKANIDLPKIDEILQWVEAKVCRSAARVLPQLMRIAPEISSRAIFILRKDLLGRTEDEVNNSVSAVFDWITLFQSNDLPKPAADVVRIIVSIVMNRRHPCLYNVVHLAAKLVECDLLDEDDRGNLIQGLGDLALETAYDNWDESHAQTHTLTFLRTSCVQLAYSLKHAGHHEQIIDDWISVTDSDPMPEVRYHPYTQVGERMIS